MAEYLFSTETPAGSFSDGAPGLTLGTVFASDANGYVTGLRWYAPSTAPSGTVTGHLYRYSDGALLASADLGAITASAWNTAEFASPVAITANLAYTIAVWTADWYPYTGSFFSAAPLSNGSHLTGFQHNVAPDFVINGTFNSGATPTFPTGNPNGACYFVDPHFTTSLVVYGTAVGAASTPATVAGVVNVRAAGVGAATTTATVAGRVAKRGAVAATATTTATVAGAVHVYGAAIGALATTGAMAARGTVSRPYTGLVERPFTGIVSRP